MSDFMLRRANPADASKVTTCIQQAYAGPLRDIPDLPDVTACANDDIASHQAWVFADQNDIAGYIVFDQVRDGIMIYNLAVAPKAQGAGLARRLMAKAEEAAREAGVWVLRLRTHRLMESTVSMYLHMGWTQVEVNGNSVLMQKDLQ
ncbi:GNAT family N-acetyltransferase [Ruegeria sp. R14_0]|uniref:GNAT family N-acetyltransferase n=1 Tax=Ruegeria sp. R14_0 TaxID=2821100 RepID=UPI001ADCA574|nr:GNAT family N-acetyltransferase [Ruegeria sp. R14_0]MBO9445251.1 GNAT family N-acetyltransferase [Ruegeria sp. R14_0]